MLRGVLKLLFLTWCSAVLSSAEDSTNTSLGDRVIKKHEECEKIISDSIDDILNDKNSDPYDEIRISDVDKYRDCKEDLDKLKREYMTANHIPEGNSKFLSVKTARGVTEIVISAPADEDAEVKELEFDVVDELCVTNRKCEDILRLVEEDKKNKNTYSERFINCNIILERVKASYIKEENLDKRKLKEDGAMAVMCTGEAKKMSLPNFFNNLDFHNPLHVAEATEKGSPEESPKSKEEVEEPLPNTPTEHRHEETEVAKESKKPAKSTPSRAFIEKGDFISCLFLVFVLAIVI